jgi:hypothetical protein
MAYSPGILSDAAFPAVATTMQRCENHPQQRPGIAETYAIRRGKRNVAS